MTSTGYLHVPSVDNIEEDVDNFEGRYVDIMEVVNIMEAFAAVLTLWRSQRGRLRQAIGALICIYLLLTSWRYVDIVEADVDKLC